MNEMWVATVYGVVGLIIFGRLCWLKIYEPSPLMLEGGYRLVGLIFFSFGVRIRCRKKKEKKENSMAEDLISEFFWFIYPLFV